jgi:MFS family permease
VRSEGLAASARHMLQHLRNPQLLATYAIGFGVLFNFIAVFTYVSFHLAAPPYDFSSTLLGAIFVTYLAGTAIAPATGWMMARLGRRRFILAVLAAWAGGALLRGAAGRCHPRRARPLRRLRHVVPDHLDRLCHRERAGRPLFGRRQYVTAFCRRQHGRLLARPRLGTGGMGGAIAMVLVVLAAMAVVAALAYRGTAA